MSNNLTTRAIILRRTNYGEADRVLTVLTPDDGQLSVVARGVRREKSKLAGGIELFAICELSLVRGANNTVGLWTLTSARIITFYEQIITDYDRLQFGYEVIKQLVSLSSTIETPSLYLVLADVLLSLNNNLIDLQLVKIWYYLHLARVRGEELNLLTDCSGMKLIEGINYNYDTGEQAFCYQENSGRFDTKIIKLLRLLAANSATILLRLGSIDKATISELLYLAQVAAKK